MSDDEVWVTAAAVILGPVLWAIRLGRLRRVSFYRDRRGLVELAATVIACVLLVFFILTTSAATDVRHDGRYVAMYLVLGLAWLRMAEAVFPFAGLSVRDDLVERRNPASVPAIAGAMLGVTCCYAGGNVGNGPGWWVVVFSAGTATIVLFSAWFALMHFQPALADAVAIDRDPAAGVRLGAFLAACGLALGWSVAGDWQSISDTILGTALVLPGITLMFLVAIIVERFARPTGARPRAPLVRLGLLPALMYVAVALATISLAGRFS